MKFSKFGKKWPSNVEIFRDINERTKKNKTSTNEKTHRSDEIGKKKELLLKQTNKQIYTVTVFGKKIKRSKPIKVLIEADNNPPSGNFVIEEEKGHYKLFRERVGEHIFKKINKRKDLDVIYWMTLEKLRSQTAFVK